MPARSLTNRFVESVKPTPKKQVGYPDADVVGLELRVSSEGRKVWTVRYRTREGLQRRMTLGTFPAVDLAAARNKAKQVIGSVADGNDPAAEARAAKARAKSEPIKTFADLAGAYFKACERGEWKPKGKKKRARTINDEKAIYRRYLEKELGQLRLGDVDRAAVKKLLRDMVDRGIGAQTNRTHAFIRQAFAFAIAEERVGTNPATGFAPLAHEKPKARTLSDLEFKAAWAALQNTSTLRDEAGGRVYIGRPMSVMIQVLALLLQRRSEVAGMMRSELDYDQATWLIPGERTKNGLPHLVPLPPCALELIMEADRLAIERLHGKAARAREEWTAPNDYPLFPGVRDVTKPMRGDSVTHAFAALCAALKIKGAGTHDLRRTGATALTSERIGVSPFIRSKVLSHRADSGGGAAVTMIHYDANEYVAEKRRALEAWEGLLLDIVGQRTRSNNVRRLKGNVA